MLSLFLSSGNSLCPRQNPDRDELLSKFLSCDVIIYNITQQVEQVEEAHWAVSGETFAAARASWVKPWNLGRWSATSFLILKELKCFFFGLVVDCEDVGGLDDSDTT